MMNTEIKNICKANRTHCFYLITFLFLWGYSIHSQAAYCSLRDPVVAINTLYPDASHHLSITKEVNRHSRNQISERLPFTLLFNELGKHTLYVVMEDNTPLGFIHARSELTGSGLIEVVWAINLDMTIKDSYFQRCRDPKSRDPIFIADMKKRVQGKSFNQLLKLVDKHQNAFSNDNPDLISAVTKSALKTIAVTEFVWGEDIDKFKRKALVYSIFDKENLEINYKDIAKKEELNNNIVFSMLLEDTIEVYDVSSNKNKVGILVHAEWSQYGFGGGFHWLFSPDGEILNITPDKPWPSHEIANEFDKALGKNIKNEEHCTTAIELAGSKLFRVSQW